MKRQQISVKSGKIKIPIDAEVYGAFAVHPPLHAGQEYWRKRTGYFVVTHVGTGYAVCDTGKANARAIAQKLNDTIPPGDFNESDLENKTPTYQEFVAKARPIVKESL